MGIADTVQLLSEIYNGEKQSLKLRYSRSRFFQKGSDTQPLGQHVSESSSFPEEQDLRIAGSLLNPTSVQNPSVPLSKSSSKQTLQTLQTLVPGASIQTCENCTQVPSEPNVQTGMIRYYSLPRIIAEDHSIPGAPAVQIDSTPQDSSRPARRPHKFFSIGRVFGGKHSRNLRITSTTSGTINASGQLSHSQSNVRDAGADSDTENRTPRNVSDRTIISEQSTWTVCRHPSKRYEDGIVPLEIEDRRGGYNPFTDRDGSRDRSGGSNPFRPTGTSSDETDIFLSSESAPLVESEHYLERPVRKSPKPSSLQPPRNQSRSLDSLSYRIFSDTSVVMRNFDQSKAAHDFNFFALKLNLVPLRVDRSGIPITGLLKISNMFSLSLSNATLGTSFSLVPAKARTPASSILRRIRSFKSTMTLKKKDNIGKRTLRRMRTLANISTQYQMSSLKGKPLESLARLGGHSFLTLPRDFAPISLKLPVCIAATAHYVALHGKPFS